MGTVSKSLSERVGKANDGRRAWRERNRDAVVDALLDLYQDGVLNPGAREVAARSGVSRRSVFRYFEDMDELCRTAIDRHSARVSHLFEIEGLGEGAVADRIDRLVQQRTNLFEAIAPVRRIAQLRSPFQPIIATELDGGRKLLRRQLEQHFAPELDELDAGHRDETLAAMDVLASFESFDLLRRAQGLSLGRTAEVLRAGLGALIRPCV